MSRVLHVTLGTPGEAVDLLLLEQLAETLRGAYRALFNESGFEGKPPIRLNIRDASEGSLRLTLEPEVEGGDDDTINAISDTLIRDIEGLTQGTPRPTAPPSLPSSRSASPPKPPTPPPTSANSKPKLTPSSKGCTLDQKRVRACA